MTRQQQADLEAALTAVCEGHRREAARRICRVLDRRDVPELLPVQSIRPVEDDRPAVRGVRAPAGAQPKPRGRIIDPALVDRYRAAHPFCALTGCLNPSTVDHIVRRGQHGDDVEANLSHLCRHHHTGDAGCDNRLKFPTKAAWLAVYEHRLPPAERVKWRAALGLPPPDIREEPPPPDAA